MWHKTERKPSVTGRLTWTSQPVIDFLFLKAKQRDESEGDPLDTFNLRRVEDRNIEISQSLLHRTMKMHENSIEDSSSKMKKDNTRIISKKSIRRESIIQAAIEVFGKKDFKTASISEIAQKAGIADGTIYQYFRNKEDLFFSIPIEKTNEFRGQLVRPVAVGGGVPARLTGKIASGYLGAVKIRNERILVFHLQRQRVEKINLLALEVDPRPKRCIDVFHLLLDICAGLVAGADYVESAAGHIADQPEAA